jgi:hypothetical protein
MRRIIASTLAVVVLAGTATASINARVQDSAPPSTFAMAAHEPTFGDIIIEETVDPADEALVDWAMDRYREAGLSLPTILLSFHADNSPCDGARGGHRIEDEVSRVYICVTELGTTRELKVKRTLLHEFAHAWDDYYLTDDIRDAFMELHGLDGWRFDVPYEERGSEYAAEVITWGLLDRPFMFGEFSQPTSWETQYGGYLTLTGAEPPHGYVWTLFAASHDIYARTPAQLEMVEQAWEQSEATGRRTEWIEVRFHDTSEPCGGEAISSQLIENRLHIQACPGSTGDIRAQLLEELTG